jgi:acyl carrier protein
VSGAPAALEEGAVGAEIRRMLAPFNAAGIDMTDDTDIAADLQIDSVDTMDLIMAIEDKYDISIPINLLSEVRTIGDLARIVVQSSPK